ncbi:MAG TPA: zinc ABC transporter substrate-binding protein [bacterium]|jgi:zinc transport system substrate-binding protein
MPRAAALAVVLGLLAAACAPRAGPPNTLAVIATFYPLYEFAQRVGGDRVAVRVLIPAGVEPHDFEPTPRDVAGVAGVRVLIYNGAGFEPWLEKLLPEVPPSAVRVNTTRGLPLRSGFRGAEGGSAPAEDPHVWLDPVLASRQVDAIIEGLSAADPGGRGAYAANGARVKADLEALHQRFASTLAHCRRRTFITTHAAFGYLARRYALMQISISGLSPETEPSPARLKQIVQEARRAGVEVIYYETLISPRVAEVIAGEVGVHTAVLNPIEGLTSEEQRRGSNYFRVMDENRRTLGSGLGCR